MARPPRARFTSRLSEFRIRAKLTQEQAAERLGITPEMVRRHERGSSMPIAATRERYSRLYGASQIELGLASAVVRLDESRSPIPSEDVVDILGRIQRLDQKSLGADLLIALDYTTVDAVSRYENVGPAGLTGPLVKHRLALEDLIEGCRHPAQRVELLRIAGRVSGLLAYMAVNRSRYPLARAYCTEAFTLADYAGSAELKAWVRGTQSFCEYYAGNFREAQELACDGQRFAGGSPQAIRLAVNGEARALAKLGEPERTHEAVDRSYVLLERNPDVPGVSPCVSFDGYSRARTASNAVTAYVDLGLRDHATTHAAVAMPEFESSDSRWSQSLIRLDIARAILHSPDGDAHEAASLVHQALTISADNAITSVVQRSRDFLREAEKWYDVAAISEVRDLVETTKLQ